MKKHIIISLISLIILLSLVITYPILRLTVTREVIVKSLISETYYAKITDQEYEFDVFISYMNDLGWVENNKLRMGGLHVFEKSGEERYILNTDVKTVMIDGKLNIKLFNKD